MKDVLIPLKLAGSLSDQVAQLVRVMAMKDQALSILGSNVRASHKKFELLCSQNVLLTQHLAESTSFTLEAVSKSFENVLDQVEYFHHPLTLFREQIWPNQIVIDGNVVFLRKQTCWVS